MQINSTSSSARTIFNMDEMDGKLSASIIAEKDADASGDASAAELGVSSSELAESPGRFGSGLDCARMGTLMRSMFRSGSGTGHAALRGPRA